jgi:chromosome segregation ATPase
MRTVRTQDAVGKTMLDFLTPIWKIGDGFSRSDMRKAFGRKHINPEKRIVEYLVRKHLLDKQRVSAGRIGRGGANFKDTYTVMQDDQDKLINAIADCTTRTGRGLRRRAKKMREKLQEKRAAAQPQQREDSYPVENSDLKLLAERIKGLTLENENLKYELSEAQEKAEALQEKIDDVEGKTSQTNGLLKSCPACHFNLEKYIKKYGSQIATIMQDCKI